MPVLTERRTPNVPPPRPACASTRCRNTHRFLLVDCPAARALALPRPPPLPRRPPPCHAGLRPHVFKVILCPSPKGGGRRPPPPLIRHREASTTSINDAPQQSSVGKFIAKTKPRTGQPTTRRESEFDVWVLPRFVEHVSGAPRLGSASTLQTSVPYSTPGGVSTRPSRLVGGACSFVRGRSAGSASAGSQPSGLPGVRARVCTHALIARRFA